MNDKRREKLRRAILLIEEVEDIIESAQDAEQESMDNIPESLQSSDRYEKMEQVYGALAHAADHCEIIADLLRAAIH